MGSLEDHKGFGALHPQFWEAVLEPPLLLTVLFCTQQTTLLLFRSQCSSITRVFTLDV